MLNSDTRKSTIIKNIVIPLLGLHNEKCNISIVSCIFNRYSSKIIKQGLKNFKGVQRRFNYLFKKNDVSFFDDYAHHPTEIRSVLDGVREVYKKEIVCIFQPHRISRLKNLKTEFTTQKSKYYNFCPLYKAGESIKLVSYKSFAKLIAKDLNVNLITIKNELS